MIVNYYQTTTNETFEGILRDFIISVASGFDISASSTLFSYIPFSTQPGDFDPNQWFNNPVMAKLPSGDKTAQKDYLENLIMPDRDGVRGMYLIPDDVW